MNIKNMSPVLTFKEFYGVKYNGNDPLKAISVFDFEDILLSFILILNDVSGRLDASLSINSTMLNRLPVTKSLRLRSFIERRGNDHFLLTNDTVIAKVITDLFNILPQVGDLKSADDLDFEEKLLDVILIYNENQYSDVGVGRDINTHEMIWNLMLMQDITGLTHVHFIRTGNIKHLIFIQFLKDTLGDQFLALEADFKGKTKVDGLYTLALTLISLYSGIEQKFKASGNSFVLIEKNESIYSFFKSFNLVCDKNTIINRKADIGFFITHPFYEHSNGTIYLVDHKHFAFALDRGWFYFLFMNSNLGQLLEHTKNFSDFQAYLGKHYYEKYLIGGLLKTLNRTGFRVIETDDKTLPDATAILNEKDIFFMEMKSSALHYKIINEQQVDKFKQFLDDNFAGNKKGATQLLKCIKNYAERDNPEMKVRYPKSKITIYPIIIYTEQHLDKYAVNDYVSEQFDIMLDKMEYPFLDIKPLVMIHYDFFVENITLLQAKSSLLKMAINHYLSYVKQRKSAYHKNKRNIDYLSSMTSFDRFIIDYERIYTLDQHYIFSSLSTIFRLKDNA